MWSRLFASCSPPHPCAFGGQCGHGWQSEARPPPDAVRKWRGVGPVRNCGSSVGFVGPQWLQMSPWPRGPEPADTRERGPEASRRPRLGDCDMAASVQEHSPCILVPGDIKPSVLCPGIWTSRRALRGTTQAPGTGGVFGIWLGWCQSPSASHRYKGCRLAGQE